MRLLGYPLFPYLFALALPVTVYAHNQAAFAAGEVLRPALVLVAAAALLVALARRLVRDPVLADVAATLPLVGVWLLGFDWQLYLLLGLAALALLFLRNSRLPGALVPVLNALAVGVLAIPAALVLQVERVADEQAVSRIPYSPFTELDDVAMEQGRPDIFHVVLDAYAGADVLAEDMGFDNSSFLAALRDMGFLVADSAVVPYNETVHSMTATFAGAYLREGEFPLDAEFPARLRSTLGALVANGPVHSVLRRNGYTFVYTDPGHQFLRFPGDGIVLEPGVSRRLTLFELHLGRVTGLDLVLPGLYEVAAEDPLIVSVKAAFDRGYIDHPGPKFVYQHVLAPHTPFIMDRTGAKTDRYPGFAGTAEGDLATGGEPARQRLYVEGYLEKLRYVNERLLDQVGRLLSAPGPKVVVIQGDHGPGARYYLDDPGRTCLRERFTTFVAVYTNDDRLRRELAWLEQPGASPVNLYRTILGHLLGLDLALLPARSSFVPFSSPDRLLPLSQARVTAACGEPAAARSGDR